jgi:hypothetical protein
LDCGRILVMNIGGLWWLKVERIGYGGGSGGGKFVRVVIEVLKVCYGGEEKSHVVKKKERKERRIFMIFL